MLRLAQHGLMQTRLTDRRPGSHLSTSFATKAATNAAPSNRALALAFSSVRALEQFHAREDSLFTVCSTVRENFAAKPCNSAQHSANTELSNYLASATICKAVKRCAIR